MNAKFLSDYIIIAPEIIAKHFRKNKEDIFNSAKSEAILQNIREGIISQIALLFSVGFITGMDVKRLCVIADTNKIQPLASVYGCLEQVLCFVLSGKKTLTDQELSNMNPIMRNKYYVSDKREFVTIYYQNRIKSIITAFGQNDCSYRFTTPKYYNEVCKIFPGKEDQSEVLIALNIPQIAKEQFDNTLTTRQERLKRLRNAPEILQDNEKKLICLAKIKDILFKDADPLDKISLYAKLKERIEKSSPVQYNSFLKDLHAFNAA